jgi:CheY-specific phosphatase CheX
MDEEIVNKAKKNKVSAYIQKPIDADELVTAISRVMASDELFEYLKNEYFSVFKESLMDGLNKMTKTLLTYKEEFSASKEYESAGMTVIVGISGKFAGRMLIDLSKETASKITAAITRKEPKDHNETVAALGEFSNIIAGNACSILNRKNKALGLRLAPPSILTGESVLISAPTFNTNTAIGQTDFGELMLNIGFKKGEEEWM